MDKRKKIAIKIVAAIVATIFIILYATLDPSEHIFFPKCPFKVISGYDCPGCGSQRAIHALLSGDFAAAWHHNAMFIITIPVVIALFAASLLKKRYPRFHQTLNSSASCMAALIILILWWIWRNIF